MRLPILILLSISLTEAKRPSEGLRYYRLPGEPFSDDFDENDDPNDDDDASHSRPLITGSGREFTLFQTKGGSTENHTGEERRRTQPQTGQIRAGSSDNYYDPRRRDDPFSHTPPRADAFGDDDDDDNPQTSVRNSNHFDFLHPISEWWSAHMSPSIQSWPKIVCHVEPSTTIKLRKTFRPLGTIIRLGANFNTQVRIWQFKSDWEDAIIGGRLTLAGRELQLTKTWQLRVGSFDDLVTRLRFRAAIDLSTFKAYARVGFRTERLSPINVMEGFTIQREVNLDGKKGHVRLQVKANVALPEPEIEYSTERHRSVVGMGDIQISLDELNLLLDY